MRIKEVYFSGYYDHSSEELVELEVYGKHLKSVSSKNASLYRGIEPYMNSIKLLETDPLFNVDIFINKVYPTLHGPMVYVYGTAEQTEFIKDNFPTIFEYFASQI